MSPVARGLFVNDEDPCSSPLAPLGLHAVRLRMKPSRVIQPVSLVCYHFVPQYGKEREEEIIKKRAAICERLPASVDEKRNHRPSSESCDDLRLWLYDRFLFYIFPYVFFPSFLFLSFGSNKRLEVPRPKGASSPLRQ